MILVRVRGNDVLVVRKRLLRQFLRQAVRFFGSDVILRVKAVLEVIILPAIKLLRLTIQLGGFGKLPGIVAVIVERIGRYDSGFPLAFAGLLLQPQPLNNGIFSRS